jgi:hypothetical protein
MQARFSVDTSPTYVTPTAGVKKVCTSIFHQEDKDVVVIILMALC